MNRKPIQKGFTIVETLVAISVLMIAIAGPLVVASRGLFSANISKNQMIASYLAQESMEVVKNIKDNNLYSGASSWINGLSGCVFQAVCDASAMNSPSIYSCPNTDYCPIYKEANGYGHVVGSNPLSPFTRFFYVHNATSWAQCFSLDECGVTVEVNWNEGSVPYKVLLTTEITSTLR